MTGSPSVEEILNMKSYQLKEYLQDNHIPVPKKQSKEFLQTVALQTHKDIEAESWTNRVITRRRSKREEADRGSSTYLSIHAKSPRDARRSSPPRHSARHSSPTQHSPTESVITTRSGASYIKRDLGSPRWRKPEEEVASVRAATIRRDQDEDEEGASSYSDLLHAAALSSPLPQVLSSIDINKKLDRAGDISRHAAASTPPPKQHHGQGTHGHEATWSGHYENHHHNKLAMMKTSDKTSTDMTLRQVETITDESLKTTDHAVTHEKHGQNPNHAETHKKHRNPDHEETHKQPGDVNPAVVKKIIAVNDEVYEPPTGSTKHTTEGDKRHHRLSSTSHAVHEGQMSRIQRLKRSASMIMSRVNDRVHKRLRKMPHVTRTTASQLSIALLMCAVLFAAVSTASYWQYLKKLEEKRAHRRWLW